MATLGSNKTASIGIRKQKRADLVAEELKRLVTQRNLKPGDRPPQETKLQETFGVSKGTIRKALRSLEVQGLMSVNVELIGSGIIVEVPLGHAFQPVQNHLFFKDVGIADAYTVRCLFEPELATGAVPYLTEDDLRALEYTIDLCGLVSTKAAMSLGQRQEGLSFHSILVTASPNLILRFCCEPVNKTIRQLVVFGNKTSPKDHTKFDASNVKFHWQILDTAHVRDVDTVRAFMNMHMDDCTHHATRMKGHMYGRLVLDSEMPRRHRPPIDDHGDSDHSNRNEGRA